MLSKNGCKIGILYQHADGPINMLMRRLCALMGNISKYNGRVCIRMTNSDKELQGRHEVE